MRKLTLLDYAQRGAWERYLEATDPAERKKAWEDYSELDKKLKAEWDKEDKQILITRIRFISSELEEEDDEERRLFLNNELEKLTNEAWKMGIEI